MGIPIFRHTLLERSQTGTPSNGRESLGAGRTWTSALPVPRTSLRYLQSSLWEVINSWENHPTQMPPMASGGFPSSSGFPSHVHFSFCIKRWIPAPSPYGSVKEPFRCPFGQEPVLNATPEPSSACCRSMTIVGYPVDPQICSFLPDNFGRLNVTRNVHWNFGRLK